MDNAGIGPCLTRHWFRPALSLPLIPFLPLSWIFRCLVAIRRGLYRFGILGSWRLPVPVIVVGNLTVGGSGKTPLVLWLVEELKRHGWRPGILSRGYGGRAEEALSVTGRSDPAGCGDEPLLLARRSGVPVFVARDRVAAGRSLLAAHPECNVLLSDDGLQHYRLQRDIELAVFDGRGYGNGRLLPAGPLRESLVRISQVTAVVFNASGGPSDAPPAVPGACLRFRMRLEGSIFVSLSVPGKSALAGDLQGRRLHAVAGIGDPNRFFAQLDRMGLIFEAHPFPDHHAYTAGDLAFAGEDVLLMTEKDAVKCAGIRLHDAWMLPVSAEIEAIDAAPPLLELILEKLDGRPVA
jgi:tetraacyldisaccharide 4'-kinase